MPAAFTVCRGGEQRRAFGCRSVALTVGSTKLQLVYGADPRVGNKTVTGESVYVFDGGVMANTGVMITISLDVGLELTWDSGLLACQCVHYSYSAGPGCCANIWAPCRSVTIELLFCAFLA